MELSVNIMPLDASLLWYFLWSTISRWSLWELVRWKPQWT